MYNFQKIWAWSQQIFKLNYLRIFYVTLLKINYKI